MQFPKCALHSATQTPVYTCIIDVDPGVPCYHVAPANTSTGPVKGHFGDTFEVLCKVGYRTTLLGTPHVLNYTNYRELEVMGYNTTCLANGTWSYVVSCVREWSN